MGGPTSKLYVPYAEYVALEDKSPTRHEWLNGVLFAVLVDGTQTWRWQFGLLDGAMYWFDGLETALNWMKLPE